MKQRAYDLVDVLPVGVFTAGPDRRVRHMNPEAGRLLGLDPASVLGRTCEEVLACAYCAPACGMRVAQRTGQVQQAFPVTLRPQGRDLSVSIDAVPIDADETAVVLRDVTETERLRSMVRDRWVFHGIVCASEPMKEVVRKVRALARREEPVLIVGEAGTGKEMVARALHAESERASRPFVAIHGDVLDGDVETELFGDPLVGRVGRLAAADGGTVFLDDLERLPASVWSRLLSFLDGGTLRLPDGDGPRRVDVRLLAATTADLKRGARRGRFHAGLLQRLGRHVIEVPALRHRPADVPVLAEHFLQTGSLALGRSEPLLSEEALRVLVEHAWPGNVRQLRGVMEAAAASTRDGEVHPEDLPPELAVERGFAPPTREARVKEALRRAGGSVTHAARILRVHRTTLWRWMESAGLRREEFVPR